MKNQPLTICKFKGGNGVFAGRLTLDSLVLPDRKSHANRPENLH